MSIEEIFEFYKTKVSEDMRHIQAESVIEALKNNFKFNHVEIIETGASSNNYDNFGILLGKFAESRHGKYHSVDINETYVKSSKGMYQTELPNLDITHHIGDSVDFLKNYSGRANLFHFDSYDLDLFNPLPAMLHGWLEFEAIKEKAPDGTICIFDDNWLKGTYIDSIVFVDGKRTDQIQRVDINYPMIGKGGLVYHYIKQRQTDWEIIGDHYKIGYNIKLIIQKKSSE